MLIFRPLLSLHLILAAAAIVMAGKPALAQRQLANQFPIRAGTALQKGANYISRSGNHYLSFQEDRNVVVKSKEGGFVWGLNDVTPRYNQIAQVGLRKDGRFGANDAQGNIIWAPSYSADRNAMLDLTFGGALQVVAANGTILWSSDGNLTPPINVFLVNADLTEDKSLLASEPGWDQCWVMKDPAIKIFATNTVSESAINAVANVYTEMTQRLNPMYPKQKLDGYKVYITNGESGAELKQLRPIGQEFGTDGTGPQSRDFLRGGASFHFLWISEQMICKTGVRTRATIGHRDTITRTFDQVVHEFAHAIDFKYVEDEIIQSFQGPAPPAEIFAMTVQNWFGAPGGAIPGPQEARLSQIFTSRTSFSPEGYGKKLGRPASAPALRTWTDKTGKFTVEAILVKSENGHVTLQKKDGSEVQVPVSALSASDQKHLREIRSE